MNIQIDAQITIDTGGSELADLVLNISTLLSRLTTQVQTIMATIQDLVNQVSETKTVADSAVALITGLKAQLDAAIASNDPAALQALSDSLGAVKQELADAVTANTPAA
jgi:hypothetical protein